VAALGDSFEYACGIERLALDCQERHVLGEDVDIRISLVDETNTRVRPDRIAREMANGNGLVALVGVQSNQFPRAMDIAVCCANRA